MKQKAMPRLTQAAFLTGLLEQFPSLEADLLDEDYSFSIHLQAGCWATHVNNCVTTGQLEEVQRAITYFQQTIERVDPATENALSVSFLEHLEFDGSTLNAKKARAMLSPAYQHLWQELRKGR